MREGVALPRYFALELPLNLCAPSHLQDGYCDHKRLKDIHGILEAFEKAAATSALGTQKIVLKIGRAGPQAAGSENSDGGESISRVEDSALLWLADAGMILRDPPVLHLLLHETVHPTRGGALRALTCAAVLVIPVLRRARADMSVVRQIRTLEGVVEREAVPKDDSNLCALTKARGRAGAAHRLGFDVCEAKR